MVHGKNTLDEFQMDNLYDAFHSRLFVDDCDLNIKIKALGEIQEMFKKEKKALDIILKEDEERY